MKNLIVEITFILMLVSSMHFQFENMRGTGNLLIKKNIVQTDCTYTEHHTLSGINYIYTFTCDGVLIGIDEVED